MTSGKVKFKVVLFYHCPALKLEGKGFSFDSSINCLTEEDNRVIALTVMDCFPMSLLCPFVLYNIELEIDIINMIFNVKLAF